MSTFEELCIERVSEASLRDQVVFADVTPLAVVKDRNVANLDLREGKLRP
jgi:hypothetical protein